MFPELPWEAHPDLSEDRLITIGRLLVTARSNAVLHQNPAIGDDNWILGCRGFQACRHEILKLAASGELDWLEVVDASKHLVFKIGSVPVRIYKGSEDDPTDRTLRQSHSEIEQLSLVFPDHDSAADLAFRFAVKTDFEGYVLEVVFVGFLGERAMLTWRVPLEPSETVLIPLSHPEEGVELPAPRVVIPGKESETKSA